MIIDEGPAAQTYYDMAGERRFYDPERALLDGRMSLSGCVNCGPQLRGWSRGLGLLGEPADTILLGAATAVGVGALVWLFMRRKKRKR